MRVTDDNLQFPNKYYWDINLNPYATILDGLADCTCYCYGAIIEDGHRPCVSRVCNANNYHKYLINGWSCMPYDESKLEFGDIIEWSEKCHVAVYVGDGICGSFYTGIHGKAYYDGKFDTRNFRTLKEMSDWMIANYPVRFFHHWSIEKENSWVGGEPDYILKHPLYSVKENPSVNQIRVLTNDMNVRNNDNEILKRAESGYFNVLGWKDSNGYRWYEVEPNKYIAGYEGRVIYLPANEGIDELKKEIQDLKEKLKKINEISGGE